MLQQLTLLNLGKPLSGETNNAHQAVPIWTSGDIYSTREWEEGECSLRVPDEPQNATHDVICRDSGDTLLHRLTDQDLRAQLLNTYACIHPHPELTVCASPAKDRQAQPIRLAQFQHSHETLIVIHRTRGLR
ncbi:MAG: hypothetical protein FRX49_08825 [Trebouxia sp. A1-2]|nr:MAG: hypothetical protein FRX49_08825 [Trebouxia sp. A1-2]